MNFRETSSGAEKVTSPRRDPWSRDRHLPKSPDMRGKSEDEDMTTSVSSSTAATFDPFNRRVSVIYRGPSSNPTNEGQLPPSPVHSNTVSKSAEPPASNKSSPTLGHSCSPKTRVQSAEPVKNRSNSIKPSPAENTEPEDQPDASKTTLDITRLMTDKSDLISEAFKIIGKYFPEKLLYAQHFSAQKRSPFTNFPNNSYTRRQVATRHRMTDNRFGHEMLRNSFQPSGYSWRPRIDTVTVFQTGISQPQLIFPPAYAPSSYHRPNGPYQSYHPIYVVPARRALHSFYNPN